MLRTEVLVIFLTVAYSTAARNIISNRYEETQTYLDNPECRPSTLDKGIKCSAVGPPIEIKSGLVGAIICFYGSE